MLLSARSGLRTLTVAVAATGLLLTSLVGVAVPEVLSGVNDDALGREPLLTPEDLGTTSLDDLQYADPTEGLSLVDPPEANSGGTAGLAYPLVIPEGRGITPELSLAYESGGEGGWVGQGWSFGVGDISVDTSFGVPLFCPRTAQQRPTCGSFESESYRIDGELLQPSATRSSWLPRVAERQDFTRRVETEYEQVIRHGDAPDNYFWEVRDKQGNVRWYGGFPDQGGPEGGAGTRTGAARNDATRDAAAIVADDRGNGFQWLLSAQRDVGVNLIRYEYATERYEARAATAGTAWRKLASGEACSGTCARHVYLSKIFYTGAAEASGHPEDPAYEVRLIRGKSRDDATIDARGGFLDLDRELLTRIEVRYSKTGDLASTYKLEYGEGAFGKTLLQSVTQVGCTAPDACDASTEATHRFDYYDDIGTGSGFAPPATWDTQNDQLGNGRLEGRASALAMSATNAGDGHVYVGFNPASPSKTGSFGGSLTFDGGTTESLVEFMDINGDGLPDKVYRTEPDLTREAPLFYRLNTSRPGDALGGDLSFGPWHTVGNLERLPIERQFGVTGGIEAYFGVVGMFNVGGSWNWSDGYFNDVNNDGLPDFVKNGTVQFNHLECADPNDRETCLPTFGASDSETRVPLTIEPLPVPDDAEIQATLALLRDVTPPVDTVRRWVAPYAGTVTIDSSALLLPAAGPGTPSACTGTGARLAIQRNGSELGQPCILSAAGERWDRQLTNVTVAKGDRLYFRFGPHPDANENEVAWDPTITYTAYGDPAVASTPAPDVNGQSQSIFSASGDFTTAGRPGAFIGLPSQGTVRFRAVLDKAATTDDVRPTIRHKHADSTKPDKDEVVTVTALTGAGGLDPLRQKSVATDGSHCVIDGAGNSFGCYGSDAQATAALQTITTAEAGRFLLSADVPIDPPVKNSTGLVVAQDNLLVNLAVDSPIDMQALAWSQIPSLCYLAAGACDPGKAQVTPPVDTDIYPATSSTAPTAPWRWDTTRDVTAVTTFTLGPDKRAGDVYLTVKTADGYQTKKKIAVASGSPAQFTDSTDLTLDKDTDYWFDLSVRNPSLSEHMSDVSVELQWKDGGTDKTETVPVTLNAAGRQGYFALGYRGWALAGYLANEARGGQALREQDFVLARSDGTAFEDSDDACTALTGGACRTDTDGMTFPGSYPQDGAGSPQFTPTAVENSFEDAYAFIPVLRDDVVTSTVLQSWQGPEAEINGTATSLASSRLGDAIPDVSAAGGSGLAPPTLMGSAGPVFSLTGGVGPATASFGFGWSRSSVDYMDMNGDGFPDLVRPDSMTFTNPRGGQSCPQGNAVQRCIAGGVTAVNQDTTFAVSGGFSGSPVGISANVRGVTNANKGRSAAKGGSATKDDYGAGVGAGVGVSASFSSPNSADPAWDDSEFDADTNKIPGDPLTDGGLAMQQLLADVNGDGLPDRVKTTPAGVFVRFNLGYGFAAQEVRWAPGGFESGESYSGAFQVGVGFAGPGKDFSGGVSRNASLDFPRYSWLDVNGDGILDALHKDDTDKTVKVAFGTGTGLSTGYEYGRTGTVPFNLLGAIAPATGDQIRQDQAVGWGGGLDFTIGFGPICVVACYIIVNPGAHFENSLSVGDVDLQDVNGDGFADSVNRKVTGAAHQEQLEVRLNRQGRTGLLKKVTNPLGGSTTLDYERKGNTLAHPGSTWVLSKVTVDDGRPGDGPNPLGPDVSTTELSYTGLRYDFLSREGLGFSAVTERELATDGAVLRSTRSRYRNGDIFEAGLPTTTAVYAGDVSDANLLQQTISTWSVLDGESRQPVDTDLLGPDALLETWATPLLTDVTQQWLNPGTGVIGQQSSISYEYDALGNTVRIADTGAPGDTADDVTATLTFSDCTISASDDLKSQFPCGTGAAAGKPAFWSNTVCPTWVSLPAVITVRDASGAVLRHRDGSPDLCDNASVTLLRELTQGTVSGGDYAETQLAYDDWGSYDRIVYPPGADGRHYAVEYTYDPGRHSDVAEVTDFELTDAEVARFLDDTVADPQIAAANTGITSRATFDGPAGQVSSRTDANDDTTRYTYDSMRRLSGVTAPDGGTVSFDYHPSDPDYGYARARHSDEFHPGDPIDTVTFVDGLGRVTEQKKDASFFTAGDRDPTVGFSVTGAVEFDVLGREVKQWYPTAQKTGQLTTYSYATSTAPPTMNVYDLLDRPTRSTAPDGSITTTSYDFATGLGTQLSRRVETDPLGRRTTTLTDVRGNVRAVDDTALGRTPLRTGYGYDPMGQLLDVTSAGVEQVANTYDLLGRRTSTKTPDGGLITYGFDRSGNQTSQQTPVQRADNNSRTTYTYAFGNLTRVDHPDATPDVRLTWGGYAGQPAGDHGAGRIVDVLDAARHQVLGYDGNGQVDSESTEMRDDHWKRGAVQTTWDYDWLGRIASQDYFDGERVTNDYDAGGLLSQVTGAETCPLEGALTAAVDASQTTITVTELPHKEPVTTPFTITVDGEQMRVTDRSPAGPENQFVYTVVRGTNGTVDVPTAAAHPSGASVSTDVQVMCTYRYLDRQEYDEFGRPAFQQVGNGNQTQLLREETTQRLARQVTTSPSQGSVAMGSLAAAAGPTSTTLTVRETFAPPAVPFVATLGSEKVRVTGRAATAQVGVYTYTATRGAKGTAAAAHPTATAVSVDRVQQNLTYRYDVVGNVTSYVNDLPPDVPSLFGGKSSQTYTYDPYYRVKTAAGVWDQAPDVRRQYTFELGYDDPTGNVTYKKQDDWESKAGCTRNCKKFPVTDTTYELGDIRYSGSKQHQLTRQGGADYSYDLDGNVVSISARRNLREMTWDSAGKMTMVVDRPNGRGGKPTFYAYDYQGERAFEDNEQGRSWFVNPWLTVRDGTAWKNIWAGNQRLATKFVQNDTYEKKAYFLHKDLQGSTNLVTDRTGGMFQHHEYFPSGEVWVDEKSTIFRTPYQFAGKYADEDHDLMDFGQRWYEPRGQHFYSVDAAVTDDPTAVIEAPELQGVYGYASNNALAFTDPDGRRPTSVQVQALTKSLRIDGDQLSLNGQIRLTKFFKQHTGLRGRLAFSVLSNFDKVQARQARRERLDTKPVLEFSLNDDSGKLRLESVKLGLGVGKRLKFLVKPKSAGATQGNLPATGSPPAPPPPPPPGWKPTKKPAVTKQSTTQPAAPAQPRSDGATG